MDQRRDSLSRCRASAHHGAGRREAGRAGAWAGREQHTWRSTSG